jgi:hypothetical protein
MAGVVHATTPTPPPNPPPPPPPPPPTLQLSQTSTSLQINVASSTLSTASSTTSSTSSSHNHNNMNYFTTTNRSPMMPSLRIKTNELFYRWFSQPERTEQLKELIHFIKTTNRMPKITDLSSFRNVK